MPVPFTGSLGVNQGYHTDFHGFEARRQTIWNLSDTLTNSYAATPPDGAIGYQTVASGSPSKKHLVFYDTATGADVIAPRTDCGESWSAVQAFNAYFTVPGTTLVANLNADLLDGYNTSTTAVNATIPVYSTGGTMFVSTPTLGGHAVNKDYADALGQGINPAADGPVVVATTAVIPNLSNASTTIDGVTLIAGQRVLVKDTASPDGIVAVSNIYDGIYVVGTVTGATAPLTRATDSDVTSELDRQYVYVSSGSTNIGHSYFQTVNDPIVDTTALNYTIFYQAVAYTEGNGITITGTSIAVKISASTSYTPGSILYNATANSINGTIISGLVQGNGVLAPTSVTGTQYGLPYWLTTTTVGTTAAGTTTTVLHGNAAGAPTWGQVVAADINNTTFVTAVTATIPITSSGGLTPVISTSMATGSLIGRNTAGTGVMEVITDIPTAITIGSAYIYRVSGTDVAIADGGTGQSTASAGFNALSPMTTLGDAIYGAASGAGTRLAGNTTAVKQFLSQTGNGTVSAAPVWTTITIGDIGSGTLGVANGGTAVATFTAGVVISPGGTTALTTVTGTNNYLPKWSSNSLTGTSLIQDDGSKLIVTGTANLMLWSGAGTGSQYWRATSTGGDLVVGLENSVGGGVFTGSSAYATLVGTVNATAVQFATNSIMRWQITSAGILQSNGAQTIQTSTGLLSIQANNGNTAIGGTGTVSIGGAPSATAQLLIQGSPALTATTRIVEITSSVSPGVAGDAYGIISTPTIVEAASGNHSLFTNLYLGAPTVTAGVATVSNTATLYIAGAMTATVSGANYALWVDAGNSRFDGNLTVDGVLSISTMTSGSILFAGASGAVSQNNAKFFWDNTAMTLALGGVTSGLVTIGTAAAAGTWTLTLPTTAGTNTYPLTTNGAGVSSWSLLNLTSAVTGTLPVANGGTGVTTGTITRVTSQTFGNAVLSQFTIAHGSAAKGNVIVSITKELTDQVWYFPVVVDATNIIIDTGFIPSADEFRLKWTY